MQKHKIVKLNLWYVLIQVSFNCENVKLNFPNNTNKSWVRLAAVVKLK